MSAFSAAEARHLAEPDDVCDRCGEPTDGSALCWYHADEAHEAELQATEGNENIREWKPARVIVEADQ